MSCSVLTDSSRHQSEGPMIVISFLSDQTIKLECLCGRWLARWSSGVSDSEKEEEEKETKERKGKEKHSWFKKPNRDLLSLTPDLMGQRSGQLYNIRTNIMSQIFDAVILIPKGTIIVMINCDLVIFIGTYPLR